MPALWHAAYQSRKEEVGVTVRALYDKLECLEPEISAALVRHTAARLEPIIRRMKGTTPPLLKAYKTKILDGNHLASSERRPKILRDVAAGCLPGQTLVVLEPETGLASDVICSEDGHAQERKLLDLIWSIVDERDLWIADRNFCTTKFLFGHVAFDPEHRLVVSVVPGKRTSENTRQLVEDFKKRTEGRIMRHITTDEYLVYETEILVAYGETVEPPRTGKPGRPAKPYKVPPKEL